MSTICRLRIIQVAVLVSRVSRHDRALFRQHVPHIQHVHDRVLPHPRAGVEHGLYAICLLRTWLPMSMHGPLGASGAYFH